MTGDSPTAARRKSLRLAGYDYSLTGAYFVTICTKDRVCSLGSIANDSMLVTLAGEIMHQTWLSLEERFPFVILDEFVVMPNHIHGVLLLTDPTPARGESVAKQLGWIIRTFKAASARSIRKAGFKDFAWQRDYFDHIVRNEGELQRIRLYIEATPRAGMRTWRTRLFEPTF